ncbi:Gfo/Idh/MocA family protein [Haloferula sp. A504]|uniref:Gfo/Idh/MocA family protein n=1 Tax=Haloferula sp. A504 TaxID=3373601 RepID=UPI0031C87F03|nr:Gfo/Idh/MocA family oxidoreductase [Verrucomicrobiaceae bacterium E54]
MRTTPMFPRRRFLQSCAIAAAPMVLPARLFGAEAPSRTLNVAVAGAGGRSRSHVADFSRIPGVRVVAVCDIWPLRTMERKAEVDRQNGDTHCKTYHDYREMMADPEVDVVSIAAPDHWHALMAVEAANHGKHLYLEKPFAYSIEEGRAVVEAVKRNAVLLQHGTQQRSTRYFQRATWLAKHGFLGEIEKVYAISPVGHIGGDPTDTRMPEGYDYDFFTGPAPRTPFFRELAIRKGTPGWYFTSAFGGGWVTAWGSHHVDSAQFALGKDHEAPVKVEARGKYPETGIFDTCHSWHSEITYADGKKIIYLTQDRPECPKVPGEIVVVGKKGWVAATRGKVWSNPPHLVERSWPKDDPELQLLDRGGQAEHFRSLIDAIRDGSRLTAPVETGHLSTTLCHLTQIGIDVQRPLRWDGKTESIIDDAQANRLRGRPMRNPWKLA